MAVRQREIIAAIKSRIRDIDVEVAMLRARQQGLEIALTIAEGNAPRVLNK